MRFLMVKTSSLGDIIHVFPVISFLRQQFPDAKIDWVVEKAFAEIVKAHPMIDKVIEINTKEWRKQFFNFNTWRGIFHFKRQLQNEKYDCVIDLQGNTKSALPTFLSRSKNKIGFGLKTIHEWPNTLVTHQRFNPPFNLNVREENLYVVQRYFKTFSPIENEKIILTLTPEQQKQFESAWSKVERCRGEKILVCPGSAWKNKQLSYEVLQDFLLKIHDHYDPTIILAWGTQQELEIAQRLCATIQRKNMVLDRLPLPALQNFMSRMDTVIAMDSLPLHLAGTAGIPSFSIFGASSAQKYMPIGKKHTSIQGSCPYGRVFERRCPILRTCPTGLCVNNLTGERLFEEFNRWKQKV